MPGNRGWNVTIVPLAEQLTGDVRTPLRTLLAAVALLFAIAVANVATLTAAATRRRGQELAIRRSFGATDSRLFRQLCTQHVLLGVAGAAAGLAAIPACVGVLRTLAPPTLPRLASIHVDAPTLMVTIGFVAIAIAVFSAIASAPRETAAVRLIEEATTYGTAERRAGGGLVMAELAVALTLGIMAALMARSVVGLRSVDMGFDAAEVVAARVSLAGAAGAGSASTVFFDDLLARVHALPGVASAGIISTRPLSAPGSATAVSDPSRPSDSAPNEVVADIRYVNPTLFDTLRIPLLAGRTFDGRETPDGPITVVISETLARSFWPNQSALGRDLQLVLYGGITASIVGVVGDVHFVDARTPARAAAYLSAARFSSGTRDLIVRASGDPLTLVPSLRAAVTALAPGVPLFQVKGMAQAVAAVTARERFTTFVLSAFAFVALALGGVGVFGVIAGEVGRRRKEIGLRMALGAGRDAVAWLMLRQTATRAAVGIAAGALIASWLAHSMTSMLFGVEPLDPASYLTTIAVVLGLALVATLIPVAGALRRSPLEALREN
jgi:predicted permease